MNKKDSILGLTELDKSKRSYYFKLINSQNFMLSYVELEKSLIISRPEWTSFQQELTLLRTEEM